MVNTYQSPVITSYKVTSGHNVYAEVSYYMQGDKAQLKIYLVNNGPSIAVEQNIKLATTDYVLDMATECFHCVAYSGQTTFIAEVKPREINIRVLGSAYPNGYAALLTGIYFR